MGNIVKIKVYADPDKPDPTLELPDVPWYASITALQAMIIGEALHPNDFSFRVIYRSVYGAFIDSIDSLADGDKPNHYWLLYINGDEAQVGATEAILLEDSAERVVIIEWRYVDTSQGKHAQAEYKTNPLPSTGATNTA
jgi:hypothetical protein